MDRLLTREGEELFAEGKLDLARERFLQAIADYPEDKQALNNLGVIACEQNQLGQAAQYFTKCISADPFYLDADDLPDRDLVDQLNCERNRLMARMESEGISVRQGTHAVHTLGYYRNRYTLDSWDYPRAFIADRLSITLPLYAQITSSEQERVVDAIQRLHDHP